MSQPGPVFNFSDGRIYYMAEKLIGNRVVQREDHIQVQMQRIALFKEVLAKSGCLQNVPDFIEA